MTLDVLIMGTGALVAFLPFLGFPTEWDTVIFVILGVIVVLLGIVVRRRGFMRRNLVPKSSPIVEERTDVHAEG